MEFLPNEKYSCYGKVESVNTSDSILNYLVTLLDGTQINLKVADSRELPVGNVYLFNFEVKFNGTRNSYTLLSETEIFK